MEWIILFMSYNIGDCIGSPESLLSIVIQSILYSLLGASDDKKLTRSKVVWW